MTTEEKTVGVTAKKISADSSKEGKGSTDTRKNYKISLKPAEVSILHPSFLCPAIIKPKAALSIIILADAKFHNTFENTEGKNGNKAGPALSGIVNRYLNIVSWSTIDKSCPAERPVFEDHGKAIENIEVHYLWKLDEIENQKLTNKAGELFALIHPEVMKMYQSKGLVHGFEITITNLPQGTGLYDLSWMSYVRKEQSENESGYFFELQDVLINEYNEEYRKEFHPLSCDVSDDSAPVFKEEPTEIQSYHPLYITEKECMDIGHLSDVHVSSRQHVFTKSKARLIDGASNDPNRSDEIGPMVNTSYATLKDLMNQMGNEVDLLIFTGDLIDYNRNFNPNNSKNGVDKIEKSGDIWKALNLDNLTDKQLYPKGIDNLVMYELFKWYYRTHGKPIMLVSGNHEAYTLPYGISPRFKFWRSLGNALSPGKWVTVHDKEGNPVYDHEGYPVKTHEKYSEEEVIENSKQQAEKDKQEARDKDNPNIYYDRANEGIPADHNLTIPEAILMYGPDYARVVMAAASDEGGDRNFKPENLEWFYKIFTPLTSFWITHGEQCFIALGWGDDEKFAGKKQGGWWVGGFLPRATKSISKEQLALLKKALEKGKSCNILSSHFTYANYNTPQAISEEGEINYNDFTGTLGKHDFGTFEKNRSTVYQKIVDNEIQYTLSGHSHRSGLYQVKDSDISYIPGRSTISINGQTTNNGKIFTPTKGCRMLVAACGGPIAVQNNTYELFNWGLDYPSGNYIKFTGTTEDKIGIKTSDIHQSRPRFTVALDFSDIFLLDKKKGGFFIEFSSDSDDGSFTLKINPEARLPDTLLFEKISLCLYNNDKIEQVSGEVRYHSKDTFKFTPDKSLRRTLLKIEKDNPKTYLKIKHKDISNIPLLQSYDHKPDWIFHVEIKSQKDIKIEQYLEALAMADYYDPKLVNKRIEHMEKTIKGYVIYRHRKYGEIPDIDWYKRYFSHEYY